MDNIFKEDRFAHIVKDPKFRRIPVNERKVKIDKRFQSMFTDERFTVNFTRDKRGRPCVQKSSENLRKYYNLSESDEETSSDSDAEDSQEISDTAESKEKKLSKKSGKTDVGDDELSLAEDNNELINKRESKKKKISKKSEKSVRLSEDESSLAEEEELSSKKSKKKVSKKSKKVRNISKDEDSKEEDFEEDSEEDSEKMFSEIKTKKKEKKVSEKLEKGDNQMPGLQKDEKGKLSKDVKKKLKNSAVDYARGDGTLLSSSSEEESIYDSDEEDAICHDWGEFDKDAEEAVESTRRLAACNMDWDKIRAVDLMVSFNSFLPSGGVIHSVTIYPSEFGMKRMKEEEVKGPMELVNDCQSDSDENEEGSSYQMEKLRQYQLNRLKYYYAVVECDSAETAEKLWNECKNIEYESSGTKFDLRFIPDDMEFDQAPKEMCDQLPDFSSYQPRVFTTTALQQEKVDLTWDETNEDRKEITKKINSGKLDDLNEKHLRYLIASGSSEDESDDNLETEKKDSEQNLKGSTIDKYKQLLKSIDDSEKEKHKNDVELECTWGYSAEKRSKEFEKDRQQKSEKLTPFEEFLEKRKEKRKAKRKSKLEENAKNSDLSESEDEVPSDIDMNDPYFAEELKKCGKKDKKNKKNNKEMLSTSPERDEQQDELELLLMDTDELDNRKHFNMDAIEKNDSLTKSKKKRLKRKNKGKDVEQEDDFNVNLNDERFQGLFTSHHFNIDPADNHYRKTKGTDVLVKEQLKRRKKN